MRGNRGDEGRGRKLGPHTPYVLHLPLFVLTLFHSLSFQALHWLTEKSWSWIVFLLHIFLTILSVIAVYCRLSKVTVWLSGRWCGDGVIVGLFAYAFVCISEMLNIFHDFTSQSKVCLLGISICCSLCRYRFQYLSCTLQSCKVLYCSDCPLITLLCLWKWISQCALGKTAALSKYSRFGR